MILWVALGTAIGMAEFESIRDAHRGLKRLGYSAVTYVKGRSDGARVTGAYIQGKGYRFEGTKRENRVETAFANWTGAGRHYRWKREASLHGILPNGPERVDNSRLRAFHSADMAWSDSHALEAEIPLFWLLTPHHNLNRELGLSEVSRFERLPDVPQKGSRHREVALYDDASRARVVLTYDPKTRRLEAFRRESSEDGPYRLVSRTLFRYRPVLAKDVRGYVPKPVPAPPALRLEAPSRPEPDRPQPNRGTTLAAVEAELRARYGKLQTLRETILGTHMSLELAWDRKAGHRLVWRERFAMAEVVGQGFRGTTWNARAKFDQVETSVREFAEPGEWLVPGAILAWQAWRNQPLNLAQERWRLRFDTWQRRPMQVLFRTLLGVDGNHAAASGPLRPIGEEEVWIDTASGLIVRTLSRGVRNYEATHHPEPNRPLTAEDLRFRPPAIDALKMLNAWQAERG